MDDLRAPPERTIDDPPALRAALVAVICILLGCSAYAAYHNRGLYLDGVYFLYRIAERSWFYLPAPPRTTVDVLRQALTVLLDRYTDLPLARLGHSLSFAMSALPALLAAACWFILPRGQKAFIVLPLAYLLIGVSPAAFMPHTEASLASAYVWVLLFLLLFRTRETISQALFIALCIPAFQTAEAACLLMPVLLLACAARLRVAAGLRERVFLALAAMLIVAIAIYQVSWVIWPRVPEDVGMLTSGLRQLEFLHADDHVNLPFVNGVVAFVALTAIAASLLFGSPKAGILRVIALSFGAFALAAIVVAFTVEQSFAPYSHYHARYFPVLIGLVLGTLAVVLHEWAPTQRAFLQQPAILSVVIFLSAAQAAADIAATWRWREYVADLQDRLSASRGLIPWESTASTGDPRRDLNWRLLNHSWLMPLMSITWAREGVVKSIIDWPAGQEWRPLDTQKPEGWPKLPSIDVRPYAEALRTQRVR